MDGLAAGGDAVYVLAGEGRTVRALSAADGAERWAATVGDSPFQTPPAVAVVDGAVVVSVPAARTPANGTLGGAVRVYDARDGTPVREYPVPLARYAAAVGPDAFYVLVDEGETLVAVDRETGETTWRATLDSPAVAPPSASATLAFVGTERGTLHALDRETGDRRWSFTPREGYPVWGAVPVGETVYVGPVYFDDRVYAVRAGGDAQRSPWAGFGVQFERLVEVVGELAGTVVVLVALAALAAGTTGVAVGGAVWAAVRAFGLSDAPPRLLAAVVFGRDPGSVTRGQTLAAHLLASVGLVLLVALVGLAAGGLAAGPASALVGLVVLAGVWAAVAYRWLPAHAAALDRPLARVRREWAALSLGFGLVAGVAYTLLLWLSVLVVFRPFG